MNSCVFDRIHIFHVSSKCVWHGICAELMHCSLELPILQYGLPAKLQERGSFICTSWFADLPEKVIIHEDHSLDEFIICNT